MEQTPQTAEEKAAFLFQTHHGLILQQGIGYNSTMDWHRKVKKHRSMFMVEEITARGNASADDIK